MGLITIITKGGWIVYVILFSSIFGLSTFIERLIKLQSVAINTDKFLEDVEQFVNEGNMDGALSLCRRYKSPVARIMYAGLKQINTSKERVMMLIEEIALHETSQLESKLDILSTVAHVAPLLGLLGTVNGMIQTFQSIQEKAQATGLASPTDLAAGIWTALITTAVGLTVAIPAVVAYNFLINRVQVVKNDMERAATKVLSFM